MSTEENKSLIRLMNERFNKGDLSTIDKYFSPRFVDHTPGPIQTTGAESMKQLLIKLREAFPDGQFIIEDMLAEGDKVVTRDTFQGTHQGAFGSIAPTGRQVRVTRIHISRIEKGKIVEDWSEGGSVMQQLSGMLPEHVR